MLFESFHGNEDVGEIKVIEFTEAKFFESLEELFFEIRFVDGIFFPLSALGLTPVPGEFLFLRREGNFKDFRLGLSFFVGNGEIFDLVGFWEDDCMVFEVIPFVEVVNLGGFLFVPLVVEVFDFDLIGLILIEFGYFNDTVVAGVVTLFVVVVFAWFADLRFFTFRFDLIFFLLFLFLYLFICLVF